VISCARSTLAHAERAGVALALLVLCALQPGRAEAQSVRGRAIDSGSGAVVPGVLLQLRSGDSAVVAGTVTDQGGRFVLRAPAAGTYRIHAERIGYEDWDSSPLELRTGQSVSRTLPLPTRPVALESLRVEATTRCRILAEQGADTRRVWNEVHKALSLTVLSERIGLHTYVIRSFDRTLDPRTGFVRFDSTSVDTMRTVEPFTAVSPDTLARRGFVVGKEPGSRTYYAPDARVLLSRSFLDTHCLALGPGRDVRDEHWIEVRFEPVPGRSMPEVSGALWLAASRAELRQLDFHYVNLAGPGRGRLGGHVEFTRMAAGGWIVSRWMLRLPEIGSRATGLGGRGERLELTGIREHGKEVLRVLDSGAGGAAEQAGADLGDPAATDLASVTVSVLSRVTGLPALDAVVVLGGTRLGRDEAGRFVRAGLRPGRYGLQIEAPGFTTLTDSVDLDIATDTHYTARLGPKLNVSVGGGRVGSVSALPHSYVMRRERIEELLGRADDVGDLVRRLGVPGLSVRRVTMHASSPTAPSYGLCFELGPSRGICDAVRIVVDGSELAADSAGSYLAGLPPERVRELRFIASVGPSAPARDAPPFGLLVVTTDSRP
jgi:hypothetical protein